MKTYFTLHELEVLPTISQGQFDNLKKENKTTRVWISRCTMADGEPYNNKVTIERLVKGCWVQDEIYQAK